MVRCTRLIAFILDNNTARLPLLPLLHPFYPARLDLFEVSIQVLNEVFIHKGSRCSASGAFFLRSSTFADLPPFYHVILDLFEISIEVRTQNGTSMLCFWRFLLLRKFESRKASLLPFYNASLDLFEVFADVLNEVRTGEGQVMLWLLRKFSLAPNFEELPNQPPNCTLILAGYHIMSLTVLNVGCLASSFPVLACRGYFFTLAIVKSFFHCF